MDLNDVKAAYIQLKSGGNALAEPIKVLHSLLMSHTALMLKVFYKTLDDSKTPPPMKGDLAVQLTQTITKKQDILCQDRIHISTVVKIRRSKLSIMKQTTHDLQNINKLYLFHHLIRSQLLNYSSRIRTIFPDFSSIQSSPRKV